MFEEIGRDDREPIERGRASRITSSSSSETYSIGEPLGYQGRGVLFRGVRTTDGATVVVKLLDSRSSRPKDVEQLKHEYEIGRLLDSPAIVRPLDLQSYEGTPALVMEDFAATSLDRLIEGPMPVDRFLTLASRIAGAVAEIHRRDVVHRDLKPANILVSPAGEVKIVDFGMASRLTRGRSALQSPSRIEGYLPYLSPEQTGRMNRSVDSRSDLYALGVTFYEMLTGRLPFEASDPLSWVHCHVARTPQAPSAIADGVPRVLSDIVLKLLSKLAEDRYQTASGLQHDLDRCLGEWAEEGELSSFRLGERDVSDRFEIVEKLYGRDAELVELVRAFERVIESGTPELLLVSGYSGIGKSSLVRELHRPLARACGFFISGKADPYKRDIPYFTFAEAFAGLITQLLAESEERLAAWRTKLEEALGANGQLIVEIIPQLELIIGKQPAIVALPPLEARLRFHLVFRQFVGVFAHREHPLGLFLDDLQWLDAGSLNLLEELALHPETGCVLLLGAYRNNEVTPSHPLALTLGRLRQGAVVHEIVLTPLDVESIGRLIADALRCNRERAEPLSRLVHEKTEGNPFFALQFLTTLHRDGLLEFDRVTSEWRWDMPKIRMQAFTDNVVDLMARKLGSLPAEAREALKLAACVGRRTDLHTLALVSKQPDEQTASDLWSAVAEGLLIETDRTYTFLHDRVQQAAYALLSDPERKRLHLEIGRLLLRSLDERQVDDRLFDVVNQLNRGADLIVDPIERDRLARLDLEAGRKAKASIAYFAARNLLNGAAFLLPEDAWESRYETTFAIFMERAECEFLCGAFEQAETLFDVVLTRARSIFDRAAVYQLRLKLCHAAGRYDDAVEVGLSALRLFGVEIPEEEGAIEEMTRAEALAVKAALGGRRIADLADVPETQDPRARAIIGLLSNVAPGVYLGRRPRLFPLVVLKLVACSLEYGPTYESCVGYSAYSVMLVSLFDDLRAAYEFSEMSIALNQKLGDVRRRGTVLHIHGGHVHFWFHPISASFPILESGFSACIESGDLGFANDITFEIVWLAIERGDTIDDVLALSTRYAAFARDSRNAAVFETVRAEQQLLKCLKGDTRGRTSFDDSTFDERGSLATIEDASFMCGVVFFSMAKLIAAFLAGDDALALEHAAKAKTFLSAAMAMLIEATFYYFHALLLARVYPQQDANEQRESLATLEAYDRKLAFWASSCPENFLSKHALVAAEIARIRGEHLEAERRYEQAIRSARENGFVHWQAIASEAAGCFHHERGLEIVAKAYFREALYCYQRWGAETKVAELEGRDPQLRGLTPLGPTATFVAPAEHLDLLSVVKASQTISGVMVREELLRTLLQLVLEEGGARSARLIVPRAGELTVAAEAAVEATPPERAGQDIGSRFPLSVVQYVLRTEQRIVLDDASIGGRFARDPYFARIRPRAVLCLPIRRQAEVVALLYVENDLVPGAFTPERLLALELLAAQAAISLENALLLERERAGRVEAEASSRRALLLAEATSLMSATFDYEGVFAALARLCARSFADWAVIDVIEDDHVVRLAGAHRDPTKEPLLRELRERYPVRFGSAMPAASALTAGQPTHLASISDEQVRSRTVDERHAELIEQLGSRSAIIIPLIARETRLGALSLVASSPFRFDPADVDLAVELGRRIALAMDNARLLRDTQQALRLREEFLSLASHELRTPLTSLRLTVEALLDASTNDKPFASDVVGRCLRRIVRETERLDDLSAELLDVARIERGELSLHPTSLDLAALAHEVAMRLEPDLRAASCTVSVSGDAPVFGKWDRSRLAQLVTVLLSNAIKFGAGRPIDVRVRKRDGAAQLSVEDRGIGIEQARLARVFERFERGVPFTHYGGLGLGLYIARAIVLAHGGSIRADSTPGIGSTFSVELPCVATASEPTHVMH